MNGISCNIITDHIKLLAKENNLPEEVVKTKVTAWQAINKTSVEPTNQEFKEYLNNKESEQLITNTITELIDNEVYSFVNENLGSEFAPVNSVMSTPSLDRLKRSATNHNLFNGSEFFNKRKHFNSLLNRKFTLNDKTSRVLSSQILDRIDKLIKFAVSTSDQSQFNSAKSEISSLLAMNEVLTDNTSSKKQYRDITVSNEGMTINSQTPSSLMNVDISAIEKSARLDMISRDFINIVTEELNNRLDIINYPEDYDDVDDVLAKASYYLDPVKGRQIVIQEIGISNIFEQLRTKYEEYATVSNEDLIDYFGVNDPKIPIKYGKVVKHFNTLISEVSPLIEHFESMKLNIDDASQNVDQYNDFSSQEIIEELNEDDENGTYANGNDGFNFQVRFADPYNTLTANIKRLLGNIVKEVRDYDAIKKIHDKDPNRDIDVTSYNKYETDDLGNIQYLKPEYVFAVLQDKLSKSVITSDDFVTVTKNENNETVYSLPALEKLSTKLPWVNQIIQSLKNDPDLISSFYSSIKTFIPISVQKDGKSFSINAPTAIEATLKEVLSNYEQGNILTNNSLYTSVSTINEATENNNPVANIKENLFYIERELDVTDIDSVTQSTNKLLDSLNALGFNPSRHLITSIISNEDSADLTQIMSAINYVVSNIDNMTADDHLIDFFNVQYRQIAEFVGEVSELGNPSTVRENGKSIPSYSASSFMHTQLKKFKDDKYRDSYLQSEFKQDPFFYRNGKFRNKWLELIETSEDFRDNFNIKEIHNIDGVEYTELTDTQLQKAFFLEYISQGINDKSDLQFAWYNTPILADSPVLKLYKSVKYTGDFKTPLLNNFTDVVKQEMYRINHVLKRKENGADPIQFYDTRGLKFLFFPGLNNSEFINQAQTFIDNKDSENLNTLIKSAVETEMNLMVEEYIESLHSDVKKDYLSLTKEYVGEDIDINTMIEEFIWNHYFASIMMTQLLVKDLAFSKDATDFQKRFKQVYSGGTKVNTNSKYGKKMSKVIYIADDNQTSTTFSSIQNIVEKALQEGRITSMDSDSILNKFQNINSADAQAYRTIDSYRSVMDMVGQWTPEGDVAIQNFQSGNWTMKDFNIVWQTIKPFMYTQIMQSDGLGGKMKVPHQNKNSEFVLLAVMQGLSNTVSASPKLKAINQYMLDNNIDVVQSESAVKTGKSGVIDLSHSPEKLREIISQKGYTNINNYKDFKSHIDNLLLDKMISQNEYNEMIEYIQMDYKEVYETFENYAGTTDNYNSDVVHELPNEDYVIQQATPEHYFDTLATFGSQGRNLIVSDISDNPSVRFNLDGKELNKAEIVNLYDSLIVENLIEDYTKLLNKFDNIETLQQIILDQIQSNPKYDSDMVNMFEIITTTDPVTGIPVKSFNIPLHNPSTTLKIQELITSLAKNGVTKQKIKGASAILVSNNGLTHQLGLVYNEDGSLKGAECYLPASSREFYEPFINEQTGLLDVEKLKSLGLDEFIGYRIPTEDKYSMIPLIVKGFLPQQNGSSIMVAADIVTIAGSDFDVDKMFLMFPEFESKSIFKQKKFQKSIENLFNLTPNEASTIISEVVIGDRASFYPEGSVELQVLDYHDSNKELFYNTKITKVKYDLTKSPQEQTRAQRNNAIIDIYKSILRNPDTADKIVNVGSFDKLKRSSRMIEIIKSKKLREDYLVYYNISPDKLQSHITANDLDSLDKFINKYKVERNPLTVNTFVYNHNQNMTGGSLIGMYANNTVSQAKYQFSELALKDKYVFSINGREIRSLHDSINGLGERISKNCAEFSAASVDGVKDPVLAVLEQNLETAKLTGFLLRAGFTIDEIALISAQPNFKSLFEDAKQAEPNWFHVKSIHSDELFENIINSSDELNSTVQEYIKYLITLSKEMSFITQVSRADSPNGAIDISIAGAQNQVRRVQMLQDKAESHNYPFIGLNTIIEPTPELKTPDELRKYLLSKNMPKLQAFYSLGINIPLRLMSKYFGFINPYSQYMLYTLHINSPRGIISKKMVDTFYKKLTEFHLSKTELFGDDGTNTYFDKFDYYKYQFPKRFIEIIRRNPKIKELSFIKKLTVDNYNQIVMKDSGKLTPIIKSTLMNSATSLLQLGTPDAQELAKGLMMYSYYTEGLSFGPNSFGNFFSTQYLNSFPEYVDSLRDMKYNILQGTHFDNFLSLFYNNYFTQLTPSLHNLIKSPEQEDSFIISENSLTVPSSIVENRNNGNLTQFDLINYKGALYQKSSNTVLNTTYTKVITNNNGIFNANVSVQENLEYIADKEIQVTNPNAIDFDDINYDDGFDYSEIADIDDYDEKVNSDITNYNNITNIDKLNKYYDPLDSQAQLDNPLCS